MARPKKDIDPDQVKKLAAIDCSYSEMASVLNCDEKTLTNRFSQVIKEGRESGCASLKRKQFEIAMSGNVSMLIWLGKIRLKQKDTTEVQNFTNISLELQNEFIELARARKLLKAKKDE
jgi:hypothetical protein